MKYLFTFKELYNKYPYTDYYVVNVEEDSLATDTTTQVIYVKRIVKGQETTFGGSVYAPYKKFVAIRETEDNIFYKEVQL